MLLNFINKIIGKSSNSTKIDYLLNDPMTPDLKASIEVPILATNPNFFVKGWKGFSISEIQKQAAQVYASMYNTTNMIKDFYGKTFKWSATESLIAVPRAGSGINAFYDRASLQFFYATHPITKKTVFTCESVNVVAHEYGHAFLDSIRPDLWSAAALEIFSFHEAFGDIVSMLSTMYNDVVIDRVIQDTSGDLRKSNLISQIAEEMGNILHASGSGGCKPSYLRNALNNLKYKRPEELPRHVGDESLSQEPHNFSRIFVGAWYDCMVGIYEYEKSKTTPNNALKLARNAMGKITFKAATITPANPKFFCAMAKSMFNVANAIFGNTYSSILRKVFFERNLFSGILMYTRKTVDVKKMKGISIGKHISSYKDGGVVEKNLIEINAKNKLKLTRLPLNLMKSKITIPCENQYFVDSNNRIIDEINATEDYVFECVESAITFLHNTNQIDTNNLDINKCFNIENGKLVRTRSCLDIIKH